DVIERAHTAGVAWMINIGIDLESTQKGIALTEMFDTVYTTAGVHPHEVKTFDLQMLKQLKTLAESPSVVGIGETGLDYYYMHSPREIQQEAFKHQLALARDMNLPVVIHSRDAQDDTLNIMKEFAQGLKGVLHCFSGSKAMAKQALDMGFLLSFSGIVTFDKAQTLKEIAAMVSDDSFLIETDAPYLSPNPKRGKRNEPAFVVHTAQAIAQLRGISLADVARITSLNTKKLFNIGAVSQKAEIAYQIRDSLYLNITSRCTNVCSFCIRFQTDTVKGHYLKLDREPDAETVISSIGNPQGYKEVVFCGLGEPFLRLDVIKAVSSWVKQHGGKVRVNTNGQANLIYGRNILHELQGIVDSLSISLDAENEDKYNAICSPNLPGAYKAVLDFIKEAPAYIPDVELSVVQTPTVDVEKCRAIAEKFKVRFRLRQLDAVG
ncbi:MAG TPA: TatD family hydrolase, partial [Thermodesulfovibrionia bacterium]|nr:TatD family hydrolase [Thermodesulfovibrionia bacterium]